VIPLSNNLPAMPPANHGGAVENMGEVATGMAVLGALTWVGRRILEGPTKSKAEAEALRKEMQDADAARRADIAHLQEQVGILSQQVSGPGFGLISVATRVEATVHELVQTVSRMAGAQEDVHK
jgi:hypothetical protein